MFYLCGCYYTTHSSDYSTGFAKQYLPIVDSTAHSTILSTTSRTVLKQTFTNSSAADPIKECIYTFPLYDGVSVISFTCRIGDKVLTGLVKEKSKAKQIFNDAVAKGETAGLLEQAAESSDVFSTKLGNVPAGSNVYVEITFIGELKHHETDGIRFTIPTSIAPRYGAGPSTAVHSTVQHREEQGMKITVDVNMPEGSLIKGIQSPSHPIAVSMGTVSTATKANPTMSKASATLSLGSTALEQDFILIVQAKDVGIPKAILENHPSIPNHRALMATIVPKFSLPPSRPELVFVADRSGSMGGNIEMLTSAMNVFLKSMPVGVKFNICSFGSTNSFLWPKSQAYNAETLAQATSHLSTFAANMGGTETFAAIRATIERRFKDIPLELILLTDGDIWGQNQVFDYVNQQVEASKGQIRIFPLGIGSGVSHALIEGLARAGNGFASAVQHGERLENSVVRMLRGALSPHITDYTLEVKYEEQDDDFEVIEKVTESLNVMLRNDEQGKPKPPQPTISLFNDSIDLENDGFHNLNESPYAHLPEISSPKILQAPHKIPTLFAFSRTTVYLLFSPDTIQRDPKSIILRATSNHGPLALEIPVEVLAAPGKTIHQLAAKKAVQDLEEGRGWIYDAKDEDDKPLKDRYQSCFQELVEREAVRLGEQFQIAGKWTSFVAVEGNGTDKESSLGGTTDTNSMTSSGDQTANTTYSLSSRPSAGAPTPILPNYQLGGMVLEQQNKNRKMMTATNTQDAFSASSPILARGEKGDGQVMSESAGKSARFRKRDKGVSLNPFGRASSSQVPQAPPPGSGMYGNSSLFGSPSGNVNSPRAQQSSAFGGSVGAGVPFGSSAASPTAPSSQGGKLFGSGISGGFGNMAAMSSPSPRGGSAPPPPPTGGLFGGYGHSQPPLPAPSSVPSPPASIVPRKGGFFGGGGFLKSSIQQLQPSIETAKATPTVDWTTKSPIDKMLGLISLQDFEGSWPADSDEINTILGVAVGRNPKGGDQKVWVTLVVIKNFEMKLKDEEGTWGLVVEKARGWLEGIGIMDLEELEAEAEMFVKERCTGTS